jgi:hypothetical protein
VGFYSFFIWKLLIAFDTLFILLMPDCHYCSWLLTFRFPDNLGANWITLVNRELVRLIFCDIFVSLAEIEMQSGKLHVKYSF